MTRPASNVVQHRALYAQLEPVLGAATAAVLSRLDALLDGYHLLAPPAENPLTIHKHELAVIAARFDDLLAAIRASDPLAQARVFAHVQPMALAEIKQGLAAALAAAPAPARHRPVDQRQRETFRAIARALGLAGVHVSATNEGTFAQTARIVYRALGVEGELADDLRPQLRDARDALSADRGDGSDEDLD